MLSFLQIFVTQVAPSGTIDLPVSDALAQLLTLVGGIKTATVLGIVVLVVQGALLFFRTPLAAFAGKAKFLIVAGLTLVAGTLSLVAAGTPWLAAITASLSASSFQVFVHQGITQLSEKKSE